jgi:hypothetical protein
MLHGWKPWIELQGMFKEAVLGNSSSLISDDDTRTAGEPAQSSRPEVDGTAWTKGRSLPADQEEIQACLAGRWDTNRDMKKMSG